MFFGFVLLILGVLFLLDNFNLLGVDVWMIFWPLLLIFWGLNILVKDFKKPHK